MLEINTLEELRGNNVVIYSIKKLLDNKTYPGFSIMTGHMGVGKSTVARLVAEQLNTGDVPVHTFNFGMKVDMKELEDTVFKMNPYEPRAFVFEELHGLDKVQQTALLNMLDTQPPNVYIICTTTERHKILKTIRSRGTIWEFKLLGQRQLAQLLDDYLEAQGIATMSRTAKEALLHSANGVPRDLLKNTDLAIAGEFTGEQLSALLGRVSEDLLFSLFCALKTQSIEFSTAVNTLMEQSSENKLPQLRDFWTRYLLECHEIDNPTIAKDKRKQLQELFSPEEAMKVGHTLVRATPDTLILELTLLNMELTNTSKRHQVGQQRDKKAVGTAQGVITSATEEGAMRKDAARVSRATINSLRLD